MTTKKWFAAMSVFAFASIISFFQINSWWADQNKFNGLIGWLGLGIVFGLIAIYFLTKVIKSSNKGDGGSSVH